MTIGYINIHELKKIMAADTDGFQWTMAKIEEKDMNDCKFWPLV